MADPAAAHSEQNESQLPVHLAMLLAQVLSGGYYVITKVAFNNKMNQIVLSLYRDLLALSLLIPAAYYFDRNSPLKLSYPVLFRLFLLGCTWIFGSQLLLFAGITFTSAEFAAAMQPCVPVFTAIIAIAFRIETVNLCKRDGQAKIAGIIVCCSGAAVMALYRGACIVDFSGLTLTSASSASSPLLLLSFLNSGGLTKWHLGALCLIGNCLCMAASINIQAPLLKAFPCPTSVTAYSYAFGALLMAITGIFFVQETAAWNLSWDVNLLAVIYNGVIASALNFGLMTWSLKRVGPIFVASYIPVQPIMAAVLSSIFIGSKIYSSSFIGMSLIFVGVFLVSWARAETFRLASLSSDTQTKGLCAENGEAVQSLREPLIHIKQRV